VFWIFLKNRNTTVKEINTKFKIMNFKLPVNKSDNLPYSYPMVRAGGLFLMIFGAGIIINLFFKGAFIMGSVLAVMSLMFSKKLSFGKPRRFQIIALLFAVLLEIILFFIMAQVLPADVAESVRLMWILLIVGAHFLPMAISFGPRFGILGLLCILNALAAMVLIGAINELFLLVDGALKFGFGVWLFKNKN